MPTTRRAFLAAASLAALATVLPAQARPRAPGRGSGSLRLAFASWPGIGSVAGPKLAHGLWSATQAELRGTDAAAAQLLVARFVSGKPQAGFASPVAKIGAGDRGSVLSRLLPGDAYFPGSHFFPDDHFLPGDMYIPAPLDVPAPDVAASGALTSRDAQSLLGRALAAGKLPREQVVLAMALVSVDPALPARGLAFGFEAR